MAVRPYIEFAEVKHIDINLLQEQKNHFSHSIRVGVQEVPQAPRRRCRPRRRNMAVKMKGLGKGLSALFQDTEMEYGKNSLLEEKEPAKEKKAEKAAAEEPKVVEKVVEVEKIKFVSDGKPAEVALNLIDPNPNQPRKHFNEEAIDELAESIKLHGVVQPLVLCKKDGRYFIIAGERRYRAAKRAGLKTVPAVLKNYTDQQIAEVALIENLQREDLNPIEASEAVRELMTRHGFTQEQVAERIGKSRSAVANMLRLLTLPKDVVDMVRTGALSQGHARALVSVSDPEKQISLAREAIDKQLSVRDLEALVAGRPLPSANPVPPAFLKNRGRRPHAPAELKDLVQTMQRVLGTKVHAIGNENKGRISIDYFSSDDIDRIYQLFDRMR